MARDPQLSAKAQQQLGLPDGFKTWSPFPFGTMNVQATQIAIADNEFTYIENFARLGDGNLRTLWDVGAPIYSAPTGLTIIWFTFYVIGSTFYMAAFLSDGSATQLDLSTMAQTQIGPPNTFYKASSGFLPYAKQWGSTYLLVCNRNTTNDYWAWDGSILYGSGGAAPLSVTISSGGSAYNLPPVATAFGGSGTGMVLQALVNAGSVVKINILSPGSGYVPGDVVQVAFAGGGSDFSAELVAHLNNTTVAAVSVAAGGSNYTNPIVTIVNGAAPGASPPTQAAAQATVVNGIITQIEVTNAGADYTYTPQVVITDPTGSGCVAQAILAPTSVYAVNIVNGGSNYTSSPAPSISFEGGGGSGAVATASITAYYQYGEITSTNVSNGGQGYTSAPAVIVAAGNNRSASATVTLWPFGVSGSAMETYLSRVWIVNPAVQVFQSIPPGNLWSVSAPGSVTDFATSDGSVSSQNTDAFLQTQYTNVRQSAGYLYFFGDGSISVVNNVNTSGSPTTTTFNYSNVDPQTGLLWRDSIQDFGRSIVVANETGVYGLYGGSVAKISGKLDQFLGSVTGGGAAVYPSSGGVTPSSAVATIFNIKHYMSLMTVQDPDTGAQRNVMAVWNEKDWTIASQSVSFNFIATQKVASRYIAYGTDGNSIYPLFDQPSSALVKRIDTKQYGGDKPFIQKEVDATWIQAQDNSAGQVGITGTMAASISGIPTPVGAQVSTLASGVFDSFFMQPAFPSPAPAFGLWGTSLGGIGCVTISVRFSSSSPDFTLGNWVIGYRDKLAYYGA